MKYTVVTSFANGHWEKHARQCVDSLWKRWPACFDKLVYVDGGIPSELRAIPVQVRDMDAMADVVEFKNAFTGVCRSRSHIGLYDYKYDAVRFFHKIAALRDASDTGILIWMDADVITHRDVPKDFIDGLISGAGFAYLDRRKYGPECGFMVFDLSYDGWEVIERLYDTYVSGQVFLLPEWHDSYVFGRMIGDYDAKNIARESDAKHIWQESPLQVYMTHYKGPVRKREMQDLPDEIVLKEAPSVRAV